MEPIKPKEEKEIQAVPPKEKPQEPQREAPEKPQTEEKTKRQILKAQIAQAIKENEQAEKLKKANQNASQ